VETHGFTPVKMPLEKTSVFVPATMFVINPLPSPRFVRVVAALVVLLNVIGFSARMALLLIKKTRVPLWENPR